MSAEWDAVVAFVQELRDADLNADTTLDDVQAPGFWVQVRTLEPFSLAGGAVGLRLVGIVEETQASAVYPALIDLFNELDAVILDATLDGTIVTVTTPEGDELPGIAVPYLLVP
jgi:hypothetical protein